MFKDQAWVPIKPEVTDKTSFIHAINLAVGGPLFPDVQTFLRVYAMSKRMALLKTQVQFLDNELKCSPLNRIA